MIDWWSHNAGTFLLGALGLTGLGALAVILSRSPVKRQRLAELTVWVFFAWLVLAAWPHRVEEVPTVTLVGTAMPTTSPDVATTAGQVAADPTEAVDWLAILGLALAIGAVACAAYLAVASALLMQLLRRARPAPAALIELSKSLPLAPRRVKIVLSNQVSRPFCCGILRPYIVFPATSMGTDRRAILLHEHAHIWRRDLLGQVLFAAGLPLLYWNPIFWWLRRESQLAAELIADDLATRHFDKASYVRELMDLAECTPRTERRVAALAVLGSQSEFFRRMEMLIQRKDSLTTRCSLVHSCARRLGAVAIATAASFAWSAPAALAQDPAPAAETGSKARTPTENRIELVVQFENRDDIGRLLTEIAAAGNKIEKLDLGKANGESTSQLANLTIATTDTEAIVRLVNRNDSKSTTMQVTRLQQVARPAKSKPEPKPVEQTANVFFNYNNTDILEIIDCCAKIGGLNIVVSPDVQGKITVRMINVPVREALEAAVETLGYAVTEHDRGILRITAPQRAPKTER